jgi:hypothetical protein
MDLETFRILRDISVYSILLPLAVFIFARNRKKLSKGVWLLGALLLASGLSDLLCLVLYKHFGINPNTIVSIYLCVQFVLLSAIYRAALTIPSHKKIIATVSILFVTFAVVNVFFIQGVTGFNTNLFTISSVVFVLYSMFYFYRLIRELPEPFIERMYMFWINTAVFIYFGINLFLFVTVDRLILKADNQFLLSWGLHNGSNALKNVILTIALYVASLDKKILDNL